MKIQDVMDRYDAEPIHARHWDSELKAFVDIRNVEVFDLIDVERGMFIGEYRVIARFNVRHERGLNGSGFWPWRVTENGVIDPC